MTWKSSNDKVARIEIGEDGIPTVHAVSSGTVRISATATDGSKKSASCIANVVTNAENIKIDQDEATIALGKTKTLKADFIDTEGNPMQPTNQLLYWFSLDATVATVNQKGVVTAKGSGTTDVYVYPAERLMEEGITFAICEVTVVTPVSRITPASTKVTLGWEEEISVPISIAPDNATQLIPEIDAPSEHLDCTYDEDNAAVVIAVKAAPDGYDGKPINTKVRLNASDGSGKSALINVTIGAAAMAVTVSAPKNQETLAVGKTLALKAAVEPKETLNRTIRWKVTEEKGLDGSDAPAGSIAAVTPQGKVTALAAGSATVVAMSASGAEGAYPIRTYVPMTKLALDVTTLSLQGAQDYQLRPIVTPDNATVEKEPGQYELTKDTLEYEVISGDDFLVFDGAVGNLHARPLPYGVKSARAVVRVTARSRRRHSENGDLYGDDSAASDSGCFRETAQDRKTRLSQGIDVDSDRCAGFGGGSGTGMDEFR